MTRISPVMSVLTRTISYPAAWLIWVIPFVIVSPLGAQITVTELQSPYSFVHDPLEKGYFISSVNGEAETAVRTPVDALTENSDRVAAVSFAT